MRYPAIYGKIVKMEPKKIFPIKTQQNAIALITAAKMMAAGLIAFLLINYYKLPLGVWAVVTIAAVTQTGLTQTLSKSLMRIIGTIIGAVIGYTIAVLASGDVTIMMISLLAVIWFSSYIALQPTIYSYAGIVTGMTIAIILFFSIAKKNFAAIAVDRSFEVLLGVLVITFLNLFLFYGVKKFYPKGIAKKTISWKRPEFKIEPRYAIPATKVALACLFTFLIWYYFKLPAGYWATITCLLIMEENHGGTLKKGFFRFISHFFAALLGFLCVLVLLHFSYEWRLIPLLLAFFMCGFLIGTENQYASMGNTIGIAISIMLLSDPGSHETMKIIFERFYNVAIGIAVAFIMLNPIEKIFFKKKVTTNPPIH